MMGKQTDRAGAIVLAVVIASYGLVGAYLRLVWATVRSRSRRAS